MPEIKVQNVIMNHTVDASFRAYDGLMTKGASLIYDPEAKCHIVKQYAQVDFSTYFNSLQIDNWKKHTYAKKFFLCIDFDGKAVVEIEEIYRNSRSVNRSVILEQVIESNDRCTIELEIPDSNKPLISFSITALETFRIFDCCYKALVNDTDIQDVYISLVSTTFKKESYISENVQSLKKNVFYENSELNDHLFVNIIDNGRTILPESLNDSNIKVYQNPNVGGSGGFTRGMIECLKMPQKPTHILLMDDDVSLIGDSLFRTFFLLRILRAEYKDYFISGAMFDYDYRNIQYEDVGYVHEENGSYGPLKPHLDMLDLENLLKNEEYDLNSQENSYAGWWYCCIPVPSIEKNGLPLPLFVRGDDVEFSIRNNARFLTLNGIAIWHVGFAGKFNAAMELYQVHRNSLIIQAASGICDNINFINRMTRLFWQEITRFAYNNAEQILDAISDFLKGPQFLVKLNGETNIKEHNQKNEKFYPCSSFSSNLNLENADPYSYVRLSRIKKLLYVITINGHLLPNFLLKKYPEAIAYDWFFVPGKNLFRKKLIAMNSNEETASLRLINRKRCFSLIFRYFKTLSQYKKTHNAVTKEYRAAFDQITSIDFWEGYLRT